MKALGNHVILEHGSNSDLVEKDGILIPHHAIENSKLGYGTILSVGPHCKLGLKPDQKVLFDKHAINKYSETVAVTREDNIILIED